MCSSRLFTIDSYWPFKSLPMGETASLKTPSASKRSTRCRIPISRLTSSRSDGSSVAAPMRSFKTAANSGYSTRGSGGSDDVPTVRGDVFETRRTVRGGDASPLFPRFGPGPVEGVGDARASSRARPLEEMLDILAHSFTHQHDRPYPRTDCAIAHNSPRRRAVVLPAPVASVARSSCSLPCMTD